MGSRPLRLVAAAAAVAVIVAACGGHRAGSSSSASSAAGGGPPGSGQAVFTEHCAVCHSLNGHDNPRLQGGDLLNFHARRAQVVQFVREMPIVHRPLTAGELQAVVNYVMAAERVAAGH